MHCPTQARSKELLQETRWTGETSSWVVISAAGPGAREQARRLQAQIQRGSGEHCRFLAFASIFRGINAGVMLLQPDLDIFHEMLGELSDPHHPEQLP